MKTSESHPIRVDFVNSVDFQVLNRLGMTFAPGKRENYGIGVYGERELGKDLGRLRDYYRIDMLVSLVEDAELRFLKIEDLPGACASHGIELVRFTIKDLSTPAPVPDFVSLIKLIGGRLNEGSTVAVHCRAGLGRTGMTAACAIVGVSGGTIDGWRAIEMVRSARAGTVETREQEEFVVDFMDHWKSA